MDSRREDKRIVEELLRYRRRRLAADVKRLKIKYEFNGALRRAEYGQG